MTQSLRGASAGSVGEESRALHQQFATEIAVERTRLLYQGSQVPTLFMLLGGLTCAALLWQPQPSLLLAGWLVFGWAPPGRLWLGAAIIIGAITLLTHLEQRAHKSVS